MALCGRERIIETFRNFNLRSSLMWLYNSNRIADRRILPCSRCRVMGRASLIIQPLHIAPWENERERRVWYLTPLIASQSNCQILLLEQLNYIWASITKESLRESLESVLKPYTITMYWLVSTLQTKVKLSEDFDCKIHNIYITYNTTLIYKFTRQYGNINKATSTRSGRVIIFSSNNLVISTSCQKCFTISSPWA